MQDISRDMRFVLEKRFGVVQIGVPVGDQFQVSLRIVEIETEDTAFLGNDIQSLALLRRKRSFGENSIHQIRLNDESVRPLFGDLTGVIIKESVDGAEGINRAEREQHHHDEQNGRSDE
ncbi:hypothetical protein [Notoacmeibacter marinus]|uniref:hypothetical protein n=1 Tax=Notoacmeibacter marinus TaxID=1876515 RepID=UPI0013B062F0|nr:hypothetical protein [Notoacmeibacter marinus]